MTTSNSTKLHNDPNRELHDLIYNSFLAFAYRKERAATLIALITGEDRSSVTPDSPIPKPPSAAILFTPGGITNNSIKTDSPFVMHLTSRHDFGPVFSHRYFVCPANLRQDWTEASLVEWFAAGTTFKHTAEKWDLKCAEDGNFYRLTLRPNLEMRYIPKNGDEELERYT